MAKPTKTTQPHKSPRKRPVSDGDEAERGTGSAAHQEDLVSVVGTAALTRRIAESLRGLRKSKGLSLDDLARRSSVSRASLSQIEAAKTNPTLAVLWKISAALEVPFSSLLGEVRETRVHLLRRDSQQVLRSADGRLESRPLSVGGLLPNVELYELRLLPHATAASEPHVPGTMENLVVLVGTLRLHVDGEIHDLAPGDAICFRADVPHAYENPGRTEARYHDLILYGGATASLR